MSAAVWTAWWVQGGPRLRTRTYGRTLTPHDTISELKSSRIAKPEPPVTGNPLARVTIASALAVTERPSRSHVDVLSSSTGDVRFTNR